MKAADKQLSAQEQGADTPPSFNQVVALAINHAEYKLQRLIEQRSTDEHWDEKDVFVDFGVELALTHIARMKAMVFKEYSDFSYEWFKVAGAVNMGKEVFTRKDCAYFRMLNGACEMFDQHAGLVEFSEKAD